MKVLTEHLKKGTFKPVYLLFGDEDYLIHFYATRLADRNVAPEDRFMNLCILEGEEATADRIIESVDTYPFMGEKRVTWVKDSHWFSGRKEGQEEEDKLRAMLEKMPDTALLIFEEEKADKRTALYKAVQKCGYCAQLSQPDEAGMIRFVARELAKEQKMLDEATAWYFLQTVGGDMRYQQLELAKLAAYKGENPVVTMADIDAICTPQPENNIFKLTDALGNRNRREAARIYERLISNNEAPQRIFYMLAQQVRRLYRMSLCRNRRLSKEECASFVGISPKVVWLYQKQAGRFSKEQLEHWLILLTETDEKVKTGQLDVEDGIWNLMAQV